MCYITGGVPRYPPMQTRRLGKFKNLSGVGWGGGGGSDHAKMSWWTVDSPVICAKKFLRVAPFSKQFLGFCMTAGHPYIKTVVLCCGCCSYKVNKSWQYPDVERFHNLCPCVDSLWGGGGGCNCTCGEGLECSSRGETRPYWASPACCAYW